MTSSPEFFSKEWADTVRDALTAGPDERLRAGKLQEYWDFFNLIKSMYPASWALGCRDLGTYLFIQWGSGEVADCRLIGPDEPPPPPPRPPPSGAWTTGRGSRGTRAAPPSAR